MSQILWPSVFPAFQATYNGRGWSLEDFLAWGESIHVVAPQNLILCQSFWPSSVPDADRGRAELTYACISFGIRFLWDFTAVL